MRARRWRPRLATAWRESIRDWKRSADTAPRKAATLPSALRHLREQMVIAAADAPGPVSGDRGPDRRGAPFCRFCWRRRRSWHPLRTGLYPGLNAILLMPDIVFPVCSPALLNDGARVTSPEDLLRCEFLHDLVAEHDGSGCDWRPWFESAGLGRAPGGLRLSPGHSRSRRRSTAWASRLAGPRWSAMSSPKEGWHAHFATR